MLASISLKAMVAIAVAHLSLSVLPGTFANAIESGHSSAPMQRRSLDLGRVTRLHRHRRRSTNLPKPNGTSGAANNDEENVKLLEAYATHLSAVNKAWQNQAMQDLKDGKTPVLFDEFQQNYEKSSTSSQTTNNDVNHHHHHQKAAAAGQQHGEQVKSGDASHTSDGEEYNSGQDKQKQQEEEKEKKDQEKKDQEEKRRKDAEEADQKKQAKGKEAEEEQKQKNAQQAEEEQRKQDNENKKKEEEQKKKEAAAKQQQQSTNQDQNTNKGKSNTSGPVAQYMGQGFDGDMTYYDVGLDACGWTDQPTGHTVAVATQWFNEFSQGDSNPNNNKICGQKVKITKNGKTLIATIDDECPGCPGKGDLDMSESLFEYFEDLGVGRCNVHWEFYNGK